jgi:hypothetical protein
MDAAGAAVTRLSLYPKIRKSGRHCKSTRILGESCAGSSSHIGCWPTLSRSSYDSLAQFRNRLLLMSTFQHPSALLGLASCAHRWRCSSAREPAFGG